jgi:hypothetical protein
MQGGGLFLSVAPMHGLVTKGQQPIHIKALDMFPQKWALRRFVLQYETDFSRQAVIADETLPG